MLTQIPAPLGYTSNMDQSMGFLTPLSFVPHSSLPYVEDMTFLQRVFNVFITAYDVVLRRLNYIPAQNKLAQTHFAAGIKGTIPHVLNMEREISVMLVNSQCSLEKPRPKMPGLIDVGGAQVKSPINLPADPITVSFIHPLTKSSKCTEPTKRKTRHLHYYLNYMILGDSWLFSGYQPSINLLKC